MSSKSRQAHNTAAHGIALVFGILGGLGALVHGIGETLQGNVTTEGIFIISWAEGPIAEYLDGDPAITLCPNLLVTGLITVVLSIATVTWSAFFANRAHGGLVLIMLSLMLLLFGGGGGPPTIVLLAGIAALGNSSPYIWWREHLPEPLLGFLGAIWPVLFTISVANGVFLVLGHVVAAYFFGSHTLTTLFSNIFLLLVVTLAFSIITGVAYDISSQNQRG